MSLKFPTPPTPPTIDKGDGVNSSAKIDAPNFFQVPFVRDSDRNFQPQETFEEVEEPEEVEEDTPTVTRQVTTPETLARDAVANGAGALTKRTVTKPEETQPAQPQRMVSPVPTESTLDASDAERGRAVLREFQAEDERLSNAKTDNVRTSSDSQPIFKNTFNQSQGYGGGFWLVTLILVGVLSFFFVRKYLLRDKPKLKKSDLFEESTAKLKSATKKITSAKSPVVKAVKLPPKKEDDDKGKHFEVRV